MIDLHTHTFHSDGADSPARVLELAQDLRLEGLAITDHNTISAYNEPIFNELHKHFAGFVMPGIEITCMFEGEVVEVLGYGFDRKILQRELDQHVLSFRDKQNKEYELILKALDQAKAVYDRSAVRFNPDQESARKAVWKELLKHPENDALFLHPESRDSSRNFTRKEIYNPESPLYVDEASLYPTVSEAVEMIHKAGGIAFLAHLYEYANADELFERMDDIVTENRLDGLECRHHCFKPEDTERLEAYCKSRHLLKSGGSDYHGSRKPGVILGNIPEMQVPRSYIDEWPERIQKAVL